MAHIKITGTGRYIPEKVLTNHDLEEMVETSDEWITTRTGIKTRHIAAYNETTSIMGANAGRKAIENAGINPDDVGLLVTATATPDMNFPSTACLIQASIGLKNAVAFDVSAACSGFIYALSIAEQYLRNGTCEKALIVCSEKYSEIVDWTDRNTCVLFGDGAAAVVLEKGKSESRGILKTIIKSDGNYADLLAVPDKKHIVMKGNTVFKIAVKTMSEITSTILKECNIESKKIKYVIPHQANSRIIKAIGDQMKLSEKQMVINVQDYGNTSAATIPIALDEVNKRGDLKPGDLVLFVAFGGGFTWGASLIEW